MDAIRKKMKSLKAETDTLYATINKFEENTAESNTIAEQADSDIRDFGKKVYRSFFFQLSIIKIKICEGTSPRDLFRRDQ